MDTNASRKTPRGWLAFARRDRLAFDRADYLAIRVILGIAVVGSVLFSLGGPVLDAVNHKPLPLSYTTRVTSDIPLPRGATHDGAATVQLLLNDATLGERLGQALPGLLIAGSTIAVAWLLFRLLGSTQAGEPFTRRNVKRINTIALVVGIGGTLAQYVQSFADSAIYTSGRLPDSAAGTLIFELSFSPLPLVVMLVIAFIGEAFRRGVELRDDVEGLV